MFLTKTQFESIRQVSWKLQDFGDKTYYTTVSETDTYLFWFDFMRLVFAPKFKNQQGVSYIPNFDTSQPVLLTPDFELKLPTLIESAIYYAENQQYNAPISLDVSKNIVLLIAEMLLIVCLAISYYYGQVKASGRVLDDSALIAPTTAESPPLI